MFVKDLVLWETCAFQFGVRTGIATQWFIVNQTFITHTLNIQNARLTRHRNRVVMGQMKCGSGSVERWDWQQQWTQIPILFLSLIHLPRLAWTYISSWTGLSHNCSSWSLPGARGQMSPRPEKTPGKQKKPQWDIAVAVPELLPHCTRISLGLGGQSLYISVGMR